MLAFRRGSSLYQQSISALFLNSSSSYLVRFKSKQVKNDENNTRQKPANIDEELLNFDRKASATYRKTFENDKQRTSIEHGSDKKQRSIRESPATSESPTQDLLRTLEIKSANRRKKYFEERDRSSSPRDELQLAKPLGFAEKKQKREGEQDKQKQKKTRPHVILDADSNEVKILTRQVADSLTPPDATPTGSDNIEQELLDALRGHRVVSKTGRRTDSKTSPLNTPVSRSKQEQEFDAQQHYAIDEEKKTMPKQRTRGDQNVDEENTTDAFSSLLRDIKLKPTRGTSRPTSSEDFLRDAVDGSVVRPRYREESDDLDQQQRGSNQRRPMRDGKRRQEYMRPHRLWSGEPLGIFTTSEFQQNASTISPIWEKYEEDELTRISSIPPRNAFEEMIQWTKEGILWKFPINNEQDIGPEADIPFYEHVLLERHLHDFPSAPLIRQFMELVCIGLGRNPYWTVEQKLEHINWFRSYFKEKLHIFNETVHTGAIKTSAPPSAAKPVSTYKPKPAAAPAPPKVVPVAAPPIVAPAGKAATASKK